MYNRLVNTTLLLLFWATNLVLTKAYFPERLLILEGERQVMMLHLGEQREYLFNEF